MRSALRSLLSLILVPLGVSIPGSLAAATVEPAPGETLPPADLVVLTVDPARPGARGRLGRLERVAPGLAAEISALQLVAPPSRRDLNAADPSTLEVRTQGLASVLPTAPAESGLERVDRSSAFELEATARELLAAVDEAAAAEPPSGEEPAVVDLNTATSLELMRLPGIGPGRAKDIIRYRRAHPFRRTSELLRVAHQGRGPAHPCQGEAIRSDRLAARAAGGAASGRVFRVEPGQRPWRVALLWISTLPED